MVQSSKYKNFVELNFCESFKIGFPCFTCNHVLQVTCNSARNNSRPLAIFRPISTFGRPKSILLGQIYCTFSMGWQLITYKNVLFSKNGRPISDPYFYHCVREVVIIIVCILSNLGISLVIGISLVMGGIVDIC